MSDKVIFNYNLGDQMRSTENQKNYELRKFMEGKTYDTRDLTRFSIEKKGKKYPSQYKYFCKAENFLEKKQADLGYIVKIIRKLRDYLNTSLSDEINSIISQFMAFNTNIEFTTLVGTFSYNAPILTLTSSRVGTNQPTIEFDISKPEVLVYLKFHLYTNKILSILDLCLLFDKSLKEFVDYSTTKQFVDKVIERFPKSADFLRGNTLNSAKNINNNDYTEDYMTFLNKTHMFFNYAKYEKTLLDPQNSFIDGSTVVEKFLQVMLYKIFFIKNSETNFEKKNLIYQDGSINIDNISFVTILQPIINKIICTDSDVQFVDGIYTLHHDLGTMFDPPDLFDFIYDLENINQKKDIIKTKISYGYFLGHEIGHIVLDDIWTLFEQQLHISPKPITEKVQEFIEIFTFNNILKPANNLTNDLFKKFNPSQLNDLNTRDTASNISRQSEMLADYCGYIVIENILDSIDSDRF